MKLKICFVYSNRAEYSILSPFIEYFKKKVKVKVLDINKEITNIQNDKNLDKVYSKCYKEFKHGKIQYVCLLGDRRELPHIALAAFNCKIPIIHIAAGEYIKGIPTYDQFFRPIVSLLSTIQICFSEQAKKEVQKLFRGISYLKSNVYVLGNPVFYGIKLNELKREIREEYDLVLMHPQSLSRENTQKDLNKLKKKIENKKTIIISGNKDENYDLIQKFYQHLAKENKNYVFVESLPKEQYFSLIKFCDKFYTNSSSISEIEFLNKNCLNVIGKRNQNRSKSFFDSQSPKLLLKLLIDYHNEKLKNI